VDQAKDAELVDIIESWFPAITALTDQVERSSMVSHGYSPATIIVEELAESLRRLTIHGSPSAAE
jgi:hypothetical protein